MATKKASGIKKNVKKVSSSVGANKFRRGGHVEKGKKDTPMIDRKPIDEGKLGRYKQMLNEKWKQKSDSRSYRTMDQYDMIANAVVRDDVPARDLHTAAFADRLSKNVYKTDDGKLVPKMVAGFTQGIKGVPSSVAYKYVKDNESKIGKIQKAKGGKLKTKTANKFAKGGRMDNPPATSPSGGQGSTGNSAVKPFDMDKEFSLFPKRAAWKDAKLPDGSSPTSAMPHPRALKKVEKAAETIEKEINEDRATSKVANRARVSGAINRHIVQPGIVSRFLRRQTPLIGGAVAVGLGVKRKLENKNANSRPAANNNKSNSTQGIWTPPSQKKDTTNSKKYGGKLKTANKFAKGGKINKKR
mgnify:CR=1 FL=1